MSRTAVAGLTIFVPLHYPHGQAQRCSSLVAARADGGNFQPILNASRRVCV